MRVMRARLATLAVALMAFGMPHEAPAGTNSAKPILVLESHVGARPEKLGTLMETLDDLLETHGFAARPATILRLVGSRGPRPGILDPDLSAAKIAQHLNDGWSEFVAARWDRAIVKLRRALEEVHRNPALVVNDITNLDLTFKAYVALAVSLQRQTDAGEAARTMIEGIRIFPSRPVARTEAWGPEGEKLYRDMYKQVQPMGRGRLSIAGGHPEAAIFVEGQLRGLGNAQLADLVPGSYRVFIRLPGVMGRQYQIQVAPNDDAYLNIDPEFDSALWVTDSSIGFRFTSEVARRKEAQYAAEASRQWTGHGVVVVLATGQDKGRPILDGIRYRDGIEVRRARIYTDITGDGSPSQLVQFLADGTTGAGIEVLRTDVAPASIEPGRRSRRISQLAIGIGALGAAASSALYLANPEGDHTIEGFAGSSIVVGAGVYLYLRESSSTSAVTAAMLGTGIAALLSGAMLYAADQDPAHAGALRPAYRDSAIHGLIIGSAGVALTGAGIWLLTRERRHSSTPIVFMERGSGLIGWAGHF